MCSRFSLLMALILCAAVVGKSAEVEFDLVSPSPMFDGWFGWSAANAGDVNGDGYSDFIVGAPREGAQPDTTGRAHIFSGSDGSLIRTLTSPSPVAGGFFGWAVSGVGDVNDDSIDDVLVTAMNEPNESVYIFSGTDGSLLHTLTSLDPGGEFGWAAESAGDVNGDGFPDIAVGAWNEFGGRVYAFSGPDGSMLFQVASPDTAELNGAFGMAVSGAGDVNGDGYDDLVVGAPFEESGASPDGAGRAYVFSGENGELLHTLISPNDQLLGGFGWSVSSAGDVNGDGRADVLIGAWAEDPSQSYENAGRAYVFDGASGVHIYSLASPWNLFGSYFGQDVSKVSDIDNDGYDDLVVGASGETVPGSPHNSGRVYLYSGFTGTLMDSLVTPHEEQNGFFGYSVAGAGRIDRDGYSRVIVGAYGEDPGASPDSSGRAYVYKIPETVGTHDVALPSVANLQLDGPFPHPWLGGTSKMTVKVGRNGAGEVRLALYDVSGRMIETLLHTVAEEGSAIEVTWNPKDRVSPGAYWWHLSGNRCETTKPMVILR